MTTKFKNILSPSNAVLLAAFTVFYAFTTGNPRQQKTVSVAADKMNVLYIGVDNPLTVAVEGIPDAKVTLASDDVQLTKTGQGKYNVFAKNPGDARILVYGEGFEQQELVFRVKRIPDPVALLENPDLYFKMDGAVTAEEFKKTSGLILNMGTCFDFDNNMKVVEFSMVKVPKEGDPVEVICRDGQLTDLAKKLIESAASGDVYYFETVKAKMESDGQVRKLNSMVFKIK